MRNVIIADERANDSPNWAIGLVRARGSGCRQHQSPSGIYPEVDVVPILIG